MKTPLLTVLNKIGFRNIAQKALYAAHVLQGGLIDSPSVTALSSYMQ
jgi:hypothetical protein